MDWFFTRRHLAVCIALVVSFITSIAQAQTTTVTRVSPAVPCPGAAISVTFTTSGTFTAGNSFSLLISDRFGSFTAPTSLTTLASAPTGNSTLVMTARLPATLPVAVITATTGYQFRVTAPGATGLASAKYPIGTIVPTLGSAGSYAFCQNTGNRQITATGEDLKWYDTQNSVPVVATGSSRNVDTRAGTPSPSFYYVTQTLNNCESARAAVRVTLSSPPTTEPSNVTIPTAYCPTNSPPTLSAQTNGTGTSLVWYTGPNSATSATPPAAPTTTGLYNYSVAQLNAAGCTGPRTEIPIRVYDAPPGRPDVANANPAFCRNELPRTLTASTTGNGTALSWTGPGITTPVGGATLTLGTSAQAGTYQVVQENANGCKSQPRDVTVTLNDRPAPPTVANVTVCKDDAQQMLTAQGTNLVWYVQGSNTPLPGAPSPSTSVPNSQTIYAVTQRNATTGCTSLTSTGLTFFVRPLPDKPTLSRPYDYCSADAPTSLTAGGNNLKWYTDGGANRGTFLSDNTLTAPTIGGNYSYQVTQTDGNKCQSEFLAVSVRVKATPAAPTTAYANNVALFCRGQATRALEATGDDLKWSTTLGGTGSAQAPSPSTTNLGDTPYYVTQTSNQGCTSSVRTVVARVVATPGAPTSAQSRTYCAGETPVQLSATERGTKWYSAATGGTGSNQAPTPGTAASNVGTPQTFYVSQTTADGCESQDRQVVTVTVKRKPGTPTGISAPSFCQTYAPSSLSAQAESNASLIWVNGGTESSTAPVSPNNINRDYVYQVLQVLDGCRSDRTDVKVTVKPTPGQPGTTPYSLCQGRESRALQATGTDLTYYSATDALLGKTAPLPSTSQTTPQIFKVSQSLDGCEGPKATYTVPVFAIPGKPAFTQPREYCAEDQASALIASGDRLLWYSVATGGSGSNQAFTPSTAASNVSNPQTFYVTQTQNDCESERQAISVTVKRKPGLPSSLNNIEFCQTYTPPALTAQPENGAKIIWQFEGRESESAPVPANNIVQTYTYQVLQELNGCRSDKATVTARTKRTPGQPGTTPFQLCQFAQGQPLRAVGDNLKFYDLSNTPLGTTPPIVPTDQARTVTYQVSQSLDGCEGPKTNYAVVVQPKPAPPITQAVNYCIEGANYPDQPKQNPQQLTAQGQNLRWYFVDGNAFPDNVVPTPSTSTTFVGDFRVTQTVNDCISDQALLRVSVLSTPAPVVSTSLVTYCRNETARPLEAAGSNLRWIDPNNGAPTSLAPVPPTINATKGGEFYQVYSIGLNGCVSSRSRIGLVVNTNPTLGLLGSTTVNYGQSASLQLRFTSSPPYTYTLTDGTSGAATDTVSSVSVKPLQTTTYRVASVSNVCGNGLPGNPATATIFVNVPTITTAALNTGTLCAGTGFVVNFTTAGTFNVGNAFKVQVADTTSKQYIDVSATGPAGPLQATLPASLKGGPYFVRVLATNPGAEVGGLPSPTVLTIRGLPGAVLSGTQDVYEGSPASLSVTFTGDGPWTFAYAGDGGQPTTVNTNANPHVLTVQPPKTATYLLTAISNNCGTGPVSGTATVTVLPLLAVEDPLTGAVSLYPVPTQNQLTVTIDMPLTANPARLTLRNLTGLPVLTQETTNSKTVLDLSQQPAGVYLLNVQVGEHRVVRKVLKL